MTESNDANSKPAVSVDVSIGKEIDRSLAEIITALLHPAAKVTGSLLADKIGIYADRVRRKREQNAQLGLSQVRANLDAAGVELEAITPPKEEELHMLMNGMSLADDENLRDLWAGPFTQVLDPKSAITAERPFISVLESLSPSDAKIIDFLASKRRTDAELKRLVRIALPRDFQKATDEEREAVEEARRFNAETRRKAHRTLEDKAILYELHKLPNSGWADNLLRQGVIERVPLPLRMPALPNIANINERNLLQVLNNLVQRFEILQQAEAQDAKLPGLLPKHSTENSFELPVMFTGFGTRLAQACGLLDEAHQ
ncbi:hypothetical protein EFQ99_32615 [Rhizobium vallis]|uniref:DUF4393 domain-containing protein n=2 Tax=Rhizobium TaxID=379 RepID=A0A2A6J2E4_9HYPH|nr:MULTISPECIES: Abi-alpha family protein [Rhizobium]PDS28296.1 hypothetical protein CO650_26940 [Rhizobium phaseoli]PDT00488.1 hypothetical protein CO666_30220 [Rhizobium chutanense]RUM18443.1 hypothetical protein EFQ99_32615 [Rhizobium vallis]